MTAATILVVDNHRDLLEVTKAMLARSYDVLTADSGRAALEILRKHRPIDLVISEAVLPGVSGPELIHSVQQSFPSTAVMLMTAYTEERLDPAIPFIQKPFTKDTLNRRVHQVLARSREVTEKLNEAFARFGQVAEISRNLQEQTSAVVSEVRNARSRSQQMRWERQMQNHPAETAVVLSISPTEEDHTSLKAIFDRPEWTLHSGSKWVFHPVLTLQPALSLLRQNRIPIVLADRDRLPGTWRELLAKAATLPDRPLVVVTSRLADESLWAEALNLGAYDVLAKPFVPEEVIAVLSFAWLRWKATRI